MRLLSLLFASLISVSSFANPPAFPLQGTVVDPSGYPIIGAQVSVVADGMSTKTAITDMKGHFSFNDVPAVTNARLEISASEFAPASVAIDREKPEMRVVIEPAALSGVITVQAPYPATPVVSSATKSPTPILDVPQSINVITAESIKDQSMQNIGDVVAYVPGIQVAQGEGNRDTPIFRGNSSTSDFYVDGVRDDVQYYRDLYNVERVEALKGPNSMIFGRSGVGGVINRVTRRAQWGQSSEVRLQGGSFGNRRASADFGDGLTESIAARVTAMYEDSGSYRDGVNLERFGFNPTIAFQLGANTSLRAGYEFFHDGRTADRGISSFAGTPVKTAGSTFFGNPDLSYSDADVHLLSASLDHAFSGDVSYRGRLSYGDYSKFYQNVYPGAVNAAGTNVSISAYNNATDRRNLFMQNDFIIQKTTGALKHTVVAGVELGRQVTDNYRNTGYFTALGPNVTSVSVSLERPVSDHSITFRQSGSDADNHGVATVAAGYIQDQIELGKFEVVAGLRYDQFEVDLRNNRNGSILGSSDNLLSPRFGLIYKPTANTSVYTSYSVSYQPRAGEQLASLTATTASLVPEKFINYELGLKWDLAPSLQLSSAIYRLDRTNVAVADPSNAARSLLVDGQRSEGIELSLAGDVSPRWSAIASYAFQDGRILRALAANAPRGARLAQLPEHSFSLWNKYDLTARWAAGVGVIHRDEVFTSTDNSVTLPAFTRFDAAVYYSLAHFGRVQANVENLLDTDYYAFAHNNHNITPGSPRAVRLAFITNF